MVESPAPLPKLPPLVKTERSEADRKRSAKDAIYYQQNKAHVDARNKIWQQANKDKCRAARKIWRAKNRKRENALSVIARIKNPEPRKASQKKHYYKDVEASRKERMESYWRNQDAERKRCQAYSKKNRKKINAQRKLREQNDPAYAIGERLRRQLIKTVLRRNTQKADSTMNLLGCPLPDFIRHLESQFVEGMSWDNRHEWEIDHIKPIAMFSMKNQDHQRECFHWTNLRPLWTELNRSKSSKWSG